ncbi:hypothetical protein D3C86_1179670 [compost metagenome]
MTSVLFGKDRIVWYLDLAELKLPRLKIAPGAIPGGKVGFTGSNFSLRKSPSATIRKPVLSCAAIFSAKIMASAISVPAVLLTAFLLS